MPFISRLDVDSEQLHSGKFSLKLDNQFHGLPSVFIIIRRIDQIEREKKKKKKLKRECWNNERDKKIKINFQHLP